VGLSGYLEIRKSLDSYTVVVVLNSKKKKERMKGGRKNSNDRFSLKTLYGFGDLNFDQAFGPRYQVIGISICNAHNVDNSCMLKHKTKSYYKPGLYGEKTMKIPIEKKKNQKLCYANYFPTSKNLK